MTPEQAYNEIRTMIVAGWVTAERDIYFEAEDKPREYGEQPFARVWVRHSSAGQRTLGGQGHRMFDRNGRIEIEVNSPTGNGLSESYQLAKVAADVFEGKSSPGGIWFKNVMWRELGQDGGFYQILVSANFNYSDVK